ncbi:hypothetical protein Tco_0511862 [Tanacetum coccineum]
MTMSKTTESIGIRSSFERLINRIRCNLDKRGTSYTKDVFSSIPYYFIWSDSKENLKVRVSYSAVAEGIILSTPRQLPRGATWYHLAATWQRWPPFDLTVDWRSITVDRWLTGGPVMVDGGGGYEVLFIRGCQYEVVKAVTRYYSRLGIRAHHWVLLEANVAAYGWWTWNNTTND